MVKRANVSISDNLHERLQLIKHKINISAIFQEAIERVIIDVEENGGVIERMESAVVYEKTKIDDISKEIERIKKTLRIK